MGKGNKLPGGEVDAATEYLESRKGEFGIKVIKPRQNHNAYSVHFYEPGGNYWEIESYEQAVEHGMGKTTNPHWSRPLPEAKFAGKGYVPQALTHGTLENDDLTTSERFYKEALGFEVVKLRPSSCYIKHPDTPWYVVCIQAQNPNRPRLSRYQRFTVALEARGAVREAHRELTASRDRWQLRELEGIRETNGAASFVFSDLNGNWWEITSARS